MAASVVAGSALEEEMDTIEPPSFCPSLGFTAASTERTESVGVVRGLLLWPSSLRPCVCRFAVRAGNQLTAHPCYNLSFLRWSGCSAWQCRCCQLLSPCGWPIRRAAPPAVCVSRKVSGAQRHLALHLSIHPPPAECLNFAERQLTGTFLDFKLYSRGNVHRGAPPAADGRRERAAARSKDRLKPLYRPLIARACRNHTACAQHV